MNRSLAIASLVFAALVPGARSDGDDKPPPPAFKAPKGWKEEKAGPFASARFRVGDGKEAASVTVTSLAKDGGGIAANVNRCGAQLGLDRLKEADALKAVREAKVGGLKGHSFDATGKGTADEPARLVVAFVRQGEVTWFFRLSGPAATVKEQKAAFERFLKTVRFAGPKR